MQTLNAVKKLQDAGFKVSNNENRQFWADSKTDRISFCNQDGEAICINVKRIGQHDDPSTDYFPGIYVDSIAQAIRLANS